MNRNATKSEAWAQFLTLLCLPSWIIVSCKLSLLNLSAAHPLLSSPTTEVQLQTSLISCLDDYVRVSYQAHFPLGLFTSIFHIWARAMVLKCKFHHAVPQLSSTLSVLTRRWIIWPLLTSPASDSDSALILIVQPHQIFVAHSFFQTFPHSIPFSWHFFPELFFIILSLST